jgi:hypothetical protein
MKTRKLLNALGLAAMAALLPLAAHGQAGVS